MYFHYFSNLKQMTIHIPGCWPKADPELSLRQPESTSMARAKGFNRNAVKRFYDNLETLMERHNFRPNNINNVDETGVTTVQGKPSKVIALKGRK